MCEAGRRMRGALIMTLALLAAAVRSRPPIAGVCDLPRDRPISDFTLDRYCRPRGEARANYKERVVLHQFLGDLVRALQDRRFPGSSSFSRRLPRGRTRRARHRHGRGDCQDRAVRRRAAHGLSGAPGRRAKTISRKLSRPLLGYPTSLLISRDGPCAFGTPVSSTRKCWSATSARCSEAVSATGNFELRARNRYRGVHVTRTKSRPEQSARPG